MACARPAFVCAAAALARPAPVPIPALHVRGPPPAIAVPWRRVRAAPTPAQIAAVKRRRRVADEAWAVFRERYVDAGDVEWDKVRAQLGARRFAEEGDLAAALEWMFGIAGDPFTRYLAPGELVAMKADIDGEMCGVGIVFTADMHGWRRTKRVVIRHVVKNSPAADAGLMRGDEITAINMSSVRRMSIDEATSRLLGKKGGKVLVSFCRGTRGINAIELNVMLTRRRFEVPTVSAEAHPVQDVGVVGYVQVREFAANTASQTRAAVRHLLSAHKIQAFVLDMRGNSGGLVDQAVEIAKLFLERDRVVVRFVGRDGSTTTEKTNWRWIWRPRVNVAHTPVIVLVDEATASASELVAAALRDNCRGVVVGAATFGKGSVQAIVPLSNGGGVAVTVARYRTPRNAAIVAGRGLRPDLFKPNLPEDAQEAVRQLFGHKRAGGRRRYEWMVSKLGACTPAEVNALPFQARRWWDLRRRAGSDVQAGRIDLHTSPHHKR